MDWDIDRLMERPRLGNAPVTVVIRGEGMNQGGAGTEGGTDEPSVEDWLERMIASVERMLEGRNQPDEILVFFGNSASGSRWPSRRPTVRPGRRLRLLPRATPDSGPVLAEAFSLATWPLVILLDPQVQISPKEFGELVQRGDEVDLVVGLRAGTRPWIFRPLEWLTCSLLGVPLADPLCPIKAIRRAAAAGICLDASGDLLHLELTAKMTFLTSLIDDCRLAERRSDHRFFSRIAQDWSALIQFLFAPNLWEGPLRPVLQAAETVAVQVPTDPTFAWTRTTRTGHPLRPPIAPLPFPSTTSLIAHSLSGFRNR